MTDLIVTPKIVMMTEAAFREKLDHHFNEVKAGLAEGTLTLDKAQTRELMKTVINDIWFAEVEAQEDKDKMIAQEEIKDEDFDAIFDKMPKFEAEAEPIEFVHAKECVIRRAIALKMCQTRLATALDGYSPALTHPERCISDFFKNSLLTDVTLVHPTTSAQYRVHRVIVASGSKYLLELFSKYPPGDKEGQLNIVKVPEPFNQKNEIHSDDQVSRILKYVYNNQDIKSIEDEINESNIYSLYAQCVALQCERLLEDLRILISKKILNEQSVLKLYLDALEHEDTKVMEDSLTLIEAHFDEILRDPEINHMEFLCAVKFNNFVEIMSSDKLSITHERVLIDIIKEYIAVRESIKPKQELMKSAEETTPKEVWALLTQDEKDNRQAIFNEQVEKRKAEELQKMEGEAALYFEKTPTEKIQHVLNVVQTKANKRIEEFSKLTRLSNEEKKQLLACIRYGQLNQTDLLTLSGDPDFILAKEYIVQGLALKLQPTKAMKYDDFPFNVNPRESIVHNQTVHPEDYDVADIIDPDMKQQMTEVKRQNDADLSSTSFHNQQPGMQSDLMKLNPHTKLNPLPPQANLGQWQNKISEERKSFVGTMNNQPPMTTKVYGQAPGQDMNQRALQYLQSGNPMWAEKMTKRELMKFVEFIASSNQLAGNTTNILNQKLVQELVHGNKNWADRMQKNELCEVAENLFGGQDLKLQRDAMNGGTWGPGRVGGGMGARFDDTLARAPIGQQFGYQTMSAGARKPQSLQPMAHQQTYQQTSSMGPKDFTYNYDFDENGALFYLGSKGRKSVWQNPHIIGQVTAFASAMGQGTVDQFVGRAVANCRTADEPYSYFAVDLGQDRLFLPTMYTLRNRASSTHVLLSWQFEGSNDRQNWHALDTRNYQSPYPDENERLQKDLEPFKQRGGTFTLLVNTDIYKDNLGYGGYRYFRVLQTGKNSGGSNQLCLSGFEIYGRCQAGRWV